MKKVGFLLFFLAQLNSVWAQNKAEAALQVMEQNFPQEKVYLLFSKDNYIAGENIWFKSFVFDGYSPSSISTSLFVELYNSNKAQLSKKIIPLFNGEGNGSFTLPDTLREGVYYVRAYTAWMTNFDEAFQYVKAIPVYNPSSPQKLVTDTSSAWTAAVFPEGGTFVDGVNTRFAVRLYSNAWAPADWSGYIVDAAKPAEKLVNFKGFDRNVGLFELKGQKGKKYQLVVEDKKGKKQTLNLPAVATAGVSLQVNSSTEAIEYILRFVNVDPNSKGYKIIGTINNSLVYKAGINKISPEVTSAIPADKLVNGVLRLTVFDEKEAVVAERLCFIQPELLKVGRPSFPPLYLSKKPRGLNAFDIAPDTNYLNYTVLVRDNITRDELENENLLSTLWLTGDLSSRIHAPARYLAYDGNLEAFDALLMSEKWKRFDWAAIMSGKFPEIKYKPEPYITYKGKVTTTGGRPAGNSTVNLIFYMADSSTQINQVQTDAQGNFVLDNLVFDEPIKVYYQLNTDKKGAPAMETNIIFEPQYVFVPYKSALPPSGYYLVKRPAGDRLSPELARAVTSRDNQKSIDEKVKVLEEVKIVAQKKSNKEKLNEQLSSGMFRSMNEDVFDLVNENQDAQSYTNILQWLQGRVAGLQIQMQNGVYVPMLRGSRVGIYLNEMATDPNQIANLPVSDIAMVKVIKGAFVGGIGGGGGGAVAIYTRRGDTRPANNAKQPPALNSVTLQGYDKVAPFYEPDYKEAAFKSITNDTRDVLYWNPNLEPNHNRPTTVKFYNNDDVQSYRVIIIGFNKNDDTPLYYNDIFK